jgi:hypothetical protein
MKKFAIREVETLKTTVAMYGGCCCGCGQEVHEGTLGEIFA